VFAHYHDFDFIINKIQRAVKGEEIGLNKNVRDTALFVSKDMIPKLNTVTPLHVDVNIVQNDILDTAAFEDSRVDFARAVYALNKDGKYLCGSTLEKMSKRYLNVVNPDDMVARYGADCFRMYEMFLGPIEASKPWNTEGISGVQGFLKRFWSLFFNRDAYIVTDEAPSKEELRAVHTCIKRVNEDIERFSFNTCVSEFMKCTNELKRLKCHKKAALQDLVVLLAPFAPHISEELWHRLGNEGTVNDAAYPIHDEKHLKQDTIEYPVSINGKKRALHHFAADASREDISAEAVKLENIQKYIEGKTIRKVIVVPKRMVNIVVG
jgi:leucyl-tRNA synthetase